MEINITPKEIVIQERIVKLIDKFTIHGFYDDPINKLVNASVTLGDDIERNIRVWDETEYDQVGQWTDFMAIDKLKIIIANI